MSAANQTVQKWVRDTRNVLLIQGVSGRLQTNTVLLLYRV